MHLRAERLVACSVNQVTPCALTLRLHCVAIALPLTLGLHVRSMAVGEFISVSSQRDSEEADVEKERVEQAKGARHILSCTTLNQHHRLCHG